MYKCMDCANTAHFFFASLFIGLPFGVNLGFLKGRLSESVEVKRWTNEAAILFPGSRALSDHVIH